jgi:hypothetical protein
VVVTGRTTDTGLTLAPMIHEFGWDLDDWDRMAAGTVAGHILECGAQASGGNFTDWDAVPDMADIGFPIVEAHRTARSWSPSTRHRRTRDSCDRLRAAPLRDRGPEGLHHPGLHRGLHLDPAGASEGRTA